MKGKLCILLAVLSCFGMLTFSSCKDKGENDYVVNTTPNIDEAGGSYEKEEDSPYIKKYSVVFITGVENIKTPVQSVEEGGKATEPTVNREGYTFLGWYTADGEKWDFATMSVNDHLMLTAWWIEN